MKPFLDEDFLLTTHAAVRLYHDYAQGQPILDCHCHLSPRELAEDRRWQNLTQLWLGGDHYKWRALRSDGVAEADITGLSDDYRKFQCWAALLPRLIGNPLYHWTQLELKRYFDIDEPLSPRNCRAVWEAAGDRLRRMSARGIVKSSGVQLIYTTDDPVDDLRWHKLLKADFDVAVLPAWRPDRAINIQKPDFGAYIAALGPDIRDLDGLKEALRGHMGRFHALGCRNSDHGLDSIPCRFEGDPDAVFQRALSGQTPTAEEAECYQTALLCFLAGEYHRRGWVMQLHFGALRSVNPPMLHRLGPDTGFDAIRGDAGAGRRLGALLGALEAADSLPKTVLYSLDPGDNASLGALIGCFQSPEARGKLQQGAAWWFNDSKKGMVEQLSSLASLSVLGNFIGMVTDSRSFLSYTRHEYFRRILCDLLGGWVEAGEYPADWDTLGELVRDICCRNAAAYFDFPLREET